MLDFSDWEEYEGLSEGSGRSEKIWLKNPMDNRIGLFKYTKSETTTEHISEKIAELLAEKIDIKTAHIDIGTYNGRIGCMSYLINTNGEILVEGVTLITKYYPNYDKERLFDPTNNEHYSLEMIFKAVSEYNLQDDIIKMIIFDSIIGNSDRHHSNWAILQSGTETRICPLYDNGSSLCFCLAEDNIKKCLGNDKMKFNSLVDSKSKSMIRIDKMVSKHPTHNQMLEYINHNFMKESLKIWIKSVVDSLNKETVEEILSSFINNGFTKDKAELLNKFICKKVSLFNNSAYIFRKGGVINMSVKNGKDYLYLVWKDNETRRLFTVGQLSRNGQYEFEYGFEVQEAISKGFNLLLSFPNLDTVYVCEKLFPVFASRLPDRKRKGIEKILSKYGMDEYDEYTLLKRSGASLPIDNLQFIDPILPDGDIPVKRIFWISGVRHYLGCEGVDCNKSVDCEVNEVLCLEREPSNPKDKFAIKVLNSKHTLIGYIPRYYAESVSARLEKGEKYFCKVYEVRKENHCNECIKVELVLKKN